MASFVPPAHDLCFDAGEYDGESRTNFDREGQR